MKIFLTDEEGHEHALDALEGWRVMEIVRDHGFGIIAECGGACACGTCQVEIAPEWLNRLYPPRDDEQAQLDENYAAPNERLSCQLIFTPELNGLRLRLSRVAMVKAA